jgi:hypothetical protein
MTDLVGGGAKMTVLAGEGIERLRTVAYGASGWPKARVLLRGRTCLCS